MPSLFRQVMAALLACIALSGALSAAESENRAQVIGTLHAVDAQKKVVNIDHPAIPEFKWPAMRMDFGVAKEVNLAPLKAGQKIQFTVTHSEKGGYLVTAISPAP
ncbi:MAG: copper-binding protein [Magnetococcales bacterium]|nr:copper-binding protein [Magnetococcales bacterium]MBF0113686.1 copper-binding protein [Magnetococcales bacterium]